MCIRDRIRNDAHGGAESFFGPFDRGVRDIDSFSDPCHYKADDDKE